MRQKLKNNIQVCVSNARAFITFENTRRTQHNFLRFGTPFHSVVLSSLPCSKIFRSRVFQARNFYVIASVSVFTIKVSYSFWTQMLIDNFNVYLKRKRKRLEKKKFTSKNCIPFEIYHQTFLHHLEINSSLFLQQ